MLRRIGEMNGATGTATCRNGPQQLKRASLSRSQFTGTALPTTAFPRQVGDHGDMDVQLGHVGKIIRETSLFSDPGLHVYCQV